MNVLNTTATTRTQQKSDAKDTQHSYMARLVTAGKVRRDSNHKPLKPVWPHNPIDATHITAVWQSLRHVNKNINSSDDDTVAVAARDDTVQQPTVTLTLVCI